MTGINPHHGTPRNPHDPTRDRRRLVKRCPPPRWRPDCARSPSRRDAGGSIRIPAVLLRRRRAEAHLRPRQRARRACRSLERRPRRRHRRDGARRGAGVPGDRWNRLARSEHRTRNPPVSLPDSRCDRPGRPARWRIRPVVRRRRAGGGVDVPRALDCSYPPWADCDDDRHPRPAPRPPGPLRHGRRRMGDGVRFASRGEPPASSARTCGCSMRWPRASAAPTTFTPSACGGGSATGSLTPWERST